MSVQAQVYGQNTGLTYVTQGQSVPFRADNFGDQGVNQVLGRYTSLALNGNLYVMSQNSTQAGIAGVVNRTVDIVQKRWDVLPLVNMHDGLLYGVPEGGLDELDFNQSVDALRCMMQPPLRTLGGLVIPVEVKVGQWWGTEMQEWKGGTA